MPHPDDVKAMIESAGGNVDKDSLMLIPDGDGVHGCFTASFPLPKDVWLTVVGCNDPAMGLRCGTSESIGIRGQHWNRNQLADAVKAAGRYAVRASTMNGKEEDFDPDAMVQNFICGLLGYWTPNGISQL